MTRASQAKDKDFEEMSEDEVNKQEGRKKGVQAELPGMETPKLNDVIRAAGSYEEARDARIKCTEKEVEKKTLLLGIMGKHGLKEYKWGDLVIKVKSTDSIKVKRVEEDEAEADEE